MIDNHEHVYAVNGEPNDELAKTHKHVYIVNDIGGGSGGATSTSALNVTSPVNESLSGTATKQNIINQQNKVAISNLQTFGNVTYGYANAEIEVVRQYIKTDEELIDLFGIVSSGAVTVNQTSVDYGNIGIYDVIFTFANGISITLKMNVVPLFDFELRDVKKYSTQTESLLSVFEAPETNVSFSNYNIVLNGAPAPSEPTPGRFEWNGVDIELLKGVRIEFNNAFALSDGREVKVVIQPIREGIYGTPENFNQSVGFDLSNYDFKIIQRNFNEITFKMSFYSQGGNEAIELDKINALFSNVQAAKFVGADINEATAYTSTTTLLLGDEKLHPQTDIPVALFSYEPYSLMLENSDNVRVLLSKNKDSSILFTIGKEYTGVRSGSFASLSWEEISLNVRVGEKSTAHFVDTIYAEKLTPTPVAVGGTIVLLSIPTGKFKVGKKYEIRASAKYTRSAGGTNPSNVGFRVIQGTSTKIEDLVTVERDATTSLSMNIPQIVGRFTFNDTQTTLVEAFVPAGQQDVTINQAKIRFTEVNEIEL